MTQKSSEANPLNTQVAGGHYKGMKIQPVQFIHANNIPYMEGNAIKYLCRWRAKNGVVDLEKAKHYIDLLIELENELEKAKAAEGDGAVLRQVCKCAHPIMGEAQTTREGAEKVCAQCWLPVPNDKVPEPEFCLCAWRKDGTAWQIGAGGEKLCAACLLPFPKGIA